jgi:hypothetical protein
MRRTKGFNFLGLQITNATVHKVSEDRTRLVLETTIGNGYAIYRDTHNGNEIVYANWITGHLEGKDKAEALRMMKLKTK